MTQKRKIADDKAATSIKSTNKMKKQPQSFLFNSMTPSEKQKYDENLEKLRHDLQSLGLSPPNLIRYP